VSSDPGNPAISPNPNTGGGGTTDANITVTIGNGTTTSGEWDGKQNKGNDKWDVVPVP
jgi:hypothetical protein